MPLNPTTAMSPSAALRSSTGTTVASSRRDCSNISSTFAASKLTVSASAFRPFVAFSVGVGATSASKVTDSGLPGSNDSSNASYPPSTSGWPRASMVSCSMVSRQMPSTRFSRAVARMRNPPSCCTRTVRGTLPLRNPGRLTLRLS